MIFPDVRIYPYKEVETGAELHESLIWESRTSTRLFARDSVTGLINVDLTPEVAVRLGAALGTTLKRGSRVVATRESGRAYRDDQALDHVGPQLDGRDGGRPADAPGDGRQALAERPELRRRLPRRRVAARPGGGAGQPLRAPGHADLGRDAARGRHALHAPGGTARPVRRGRLDHVPGTRSRELRRRAARDAGRRRDPRPPVPDRGRLRGVGGFVRAAARARAARGRIRCVAPVRLGLVHAAARLRRDARRGAPARRRRRGRSQRRVRPRGRAAVPRRREGRGGAAREGAAALPPPARGRRPSGPCRCSGHRHEPGRLDGRRRALGRPHAGLAARARERGGAGGDDLRGRHRRRLHLPALPARLRRDGRALQPARAARADRAAAVRDRRRAAALDASCTARCTARGR